MFTAALAIASLAGIFPAVQPPQGEIVRGPHGVPHVFSDSLEGAFHHAGYAVAQDRLWQMELSRRSARGRLSALVGRSALRSDRDALRFGYTEAEYAQLFSRLSDRTQRLLTSYAGGINAWIEEAAESEKLPLKFQGNRPPPWTVADSLAIGVNLVRQFGRGGGGEIRNLLAYTYLNGRLGDRALDAFQDLFWQNDAASIPTCPVNDDPLKGESPFKKVSEDVLKEHAGLLPRVNMLELLPAIRISEQAEMKVLAEQMGLPHKWGSYAMVISAARSAIGVPLLLSGPQMGFQSPSVVHQMSISCPEYTAVGMGVPGVPGVLVGHSPTLAWGLTSGVADTDDIFFLKLNPDNPDQYEYQGEWREFDVVEPPIVIRDAEPTTGRREMSAYGPVVLKSVSTGVAYARKSTIWMAETDGLEALLDLPACRTMREVRQVALTINANFNLFAAAADGQIGWFYCGRVPLRPPNVDPRLPAPARHEWVGIVAADSMPYVVNPGQGWIANWNNKPVAWWPNMDTPVWGRIFRNEILVKQMRDKRRISAQDLERFARRLSTHKIEPDYFVNDLLGCGQASDASAAQRRALDYLRYWDGDYMEGSVAPVIYDAWFEALQREVFFETYGSFLSPANFQMVVQPTLVWNALRGRTRIAYMNGRDLTEVLWSAFETAVSSLENGRGPDVAAWRYRAPRINFGDLPDVLYSNRGTYIQVIEMWPEPRGRFVAPPASPRNLNRCSKVNSPKWPPTGCPFL